MLKLLMLQQCFFLKRKWMLDLKVRLIESKFFESETVLF